MGDRKKVSRGGGKVIGRGTRLGRSNVKEGGIDSEEKW